MTARRIFHSTSCVLTLATYDNLDRLTREQFPDSSGVDYTYDNLSRLTRVVDATGQYDFAYDNLGRLTSATSAYAFLTSRNFVVSYGYDLASNRTSMTDPESGSTTYAYDVLNRLTTLTAPSAFGSGNFGFSYDDLSRRTQMTRPNGVNTDYAYDTLSRLTSILHKLSGNTLDGISYTVDNVGNRTSKTDSPTSTTSNFSYDNIYQLTQVTQGAATPEAYTYDVVGNRLSSVSAATWSYNSSNHLTSISGTPGTTFTYDNNGNTLTKTDASGTTSYSWDYENRLESVALPNSGGTVYFTYDPLGRRIRKVFGGATTIYAYDGVNVIQETDAVGAVQARLTTTLSTDEPLAQIRSGLIHFYSADGLGSITSLTDSSGSVAATYGYDTSGNVTGTGTVVNRVRFTGRELDAETGLYYYRFRVYDPSTARFLSEDPLQTNGGDVNFYRYVGNNAVNFVDPTGLHRVNSPRRGTPNSTSYYPNPKNPSEVTVRRYGPDGNAVNDYDFGHDHGAGDPHAHDWGKDKDGKPVRGKGRPIKPGENVPPRECPPPPSETRRVELPPCAPGENWDYCDDLPRPRLLPPVRIFFPWLPPVPAGIPGFAPALRPILGPA